MRRNRLFALLSALPLLLVCSKTCPWRKLLSEYRHRRFFAGESGCAAAAAAAAAAEGRDGQAQFAFPRLIHQTWKTKNESLQPSWVRRSVASWKAANPGFVHRVWDDGEMEAHVTAHHPEYLASYSKLRIVEKADFFRYMVLHDIGGVYADVDVDAICSVESWGRSAMHGQLVRHGTGGALWETLPQEPTVAVLDGILGFERLAPTIEGLGLQRFPQLIQWTMAVSKGHPILLAVMDIIQANVASQRFDAGNGDGVGLGPVEKTGPVAFTHGVVPYLKANHVSDGAQLDIEKTHLVGRILIARRDGLRRELVHHNARGSWKACGMAQSIQFASYCDALATGYLCVLGVLFARRKAP